ARGGADLNGREVVFILADFQQGDVEGAATEVEDEDELVLLAALEAVGQGGRGGLVDDARDVEAGDLTGVLGRLALGVVEVCGNGDHCIGDLFLQVLLGVVLELLEDACRDLGSGQLLVTELRRPIAAHVALDRRHRVLGVGHGMALGDLTDQRVAVLVASDDGRCSAARCWWRASPGGVVRLPCAFAWTWGSPPPSPATSEFVVPRSIPTPRPMCSLLTLSEFLRPQCARSGGSAVRASTTLPFAGRRADPLDRTH